MSPLLIALVSLLPAAAMLAAVIFLLIKNDRKNKTMKAAAKRSLQVRKAVKRQAETLRRQAKRQAKSLERVFRIFNDLIVREVHTGSYEQVDKIVTALKVEEICNLRRTSVMGITRLFIEKGRQDAAVRLLTKYIRPERGDQLLYFIEPLLELDKLGLLPRDLHEFCSTFQTAPGARALSYLSETYDAANEVDRCNFQRLIIGPLAALPQGDRNLMDIRFSAEQRRRLVERVKESLDKHQPLSLIRLGDGEAYAYPPIAIEGVPSSSEADDVSFELDWWKARPEPAVRDDLTARIRQAVARCDILGFPSVYRIIRNLPPPKRPYGKIRNQRAFVRLLGALGETIPLDEKLLTEERCHRIRGAIDAALLFELSKTAKSVVLVSSWSQLSLKFPSGVTVETIAVPPEDAPVKIFDIYPEIVDHVRSASEPGTLVLVGAGIVGKILVDEAKLRGAVALDVGSLLDYMMDRKTRTIADLI